MQVLTTIKDWECISYHTPLSLAEADKCSFWPQSEDAHKVLTTMRDGDGRFLPQRETENSGSYHNLRLRIKVLTTISKAEKAGSYHNQRLRIQILTTIRGWEYRFLPQSEAETGGSYHNQRLRIQILSTIRGWDWRFLPQSEAETGGSYHNQRLGLEVLTTIRGWE